MDDPASVLAPAGREYRGSTTDPLRWTTWSPRKGDILVCTPPKCGTTWTQTMLAMLVNGSADLPDKVPVLSPWVDADLGVSADEVATTLAAQKQRRVVKTHTPADGFPIWEGVKVIAVYRHPLDIFFSLRKHEANKRVVTPDHPMSLPVPDSIRRFINDPVDPDDFDKDTLASLTLHYSETVLSGRYPNLDVFHYSDMLRDGHRTVQHLAKAAGIEASAELIDQVAAATVFGAMKARAVDYAPVGGTGYWKSDAGFFDSGSSGKWEGQLSPAEIDLFNTRLAELVPDEKARTWLLAGGS
ncbi:sulfotransferase domain-containing protein [Defluviimonas salinarum]|uniref:Sulfotransferase domain-containing protein n=1 Tax=Defluviimonas salinarum TaxID=2992147 RepID=A0ABT3IYH2_9RHOB|nr:sulfotransferase domain-containing protein [Defluviimonas salinarum]MCW3780264.1 sulfotransferase domain-containing protein [Defluviimonas salinarum]